jgi:hypothetical protein
MVIEYFYLAGLKYAVISRWFGKFKKLTTGKRNLHFIEIEGYGKKDTLFRQNWRPQYLVLKVKTTEMLIFY